MSNTNECPVCYEQLDTSDTPVTCGHIFHKLCIDKWLEHYSTCPYCRHQLTDKHDDTDDDTDDILPELISWHAPNHLVTAELDPYQGMVAVQQNGHALAFVPDHLWTAELNRSMPENPA